MDGNRVDLVEDVDAGDVNTVALNDINELVHCRVHFERNVTAVNSVLFQNGNNRVFTHVGHFDTKSLGDGHTTLVLPLEDDVGSRLVEPNTETLKFSLDDALVGQRLLAIEHDKNQGACSGHTNNLATTTLTVLGSLNNTGQI